MDKTAELDLAFVRGFQEKCAENGCDPEAVILIYNGLQKSGNIRTRAALLGMKLLGKMPTSLLRGMGTAQRGAKAFGDLTKADAMNILQRAPGAASNFGKGVLGGALKPGTMKHHLNLPGRQWLGQMMNPGLYANSPAARMGVSAGQKLLPAGIIGGLGLSGYNQQMNQYQ